MLELNQKWKRSQAFSEIIRSYRKMLGIAKDPLQHTSMYERMEEGIK